MANGIIEHEKKIKEFHRHNCVKCVLWVLQLSKVYYYEYVDILYYIPLVRFLNIQGSRASSRSNDSNQVYQKYWGNI